VVINSGLLDKITFNFSNSPGWTDSKIYPGDLFLDTNSDKTWDYVISLYNGNTSATTGNGLYLPQIIVNQTTANQAPVYSINLALDNHTQGTPGSFGYLVSGDDNIGYWLGSGIRNNQPFAVTGLISPSLGNADVSFQGDSVVFNLANVDIPVNNTLTFSFTPNCSNDVIYASVNPAPSVPEPGTSVLFGSGLVMMVGALRKKKSK
jgi:hypothetical protein